MEPAWTAFFGHTHAGGRLGALAGGCAAILAEILVAEPSAGRALGRLLVAP
jgi:hypothetical protein